MQDDTDLLTDFVIESRELLESVEPDLMKLDVSQEEPDEELVNRIFRAVHSVKGAAGFFGLASIGALSHALESFLMRVRDREMRPTGEMIDLLLDANDRLRALVDDVEHSNDVSVVESIERLQEYVDDHATAPTSLSEEPPPPDQKVASENPRGFLQDQRTGSFLSDWASQDEFNLDSIDREQLRRNGLRLYRLTIFHSKDVSARSRSVAELLQQLATVGQVVHSTFDPDLLKRITDSGIQSYSFHVYIASVLGPELAAEGFELNADQIEDLTSTELVDASIVPDSPSEQHKTRATSRSEMMRSGAPPTPFGMGGAGHDGRGPTQVDETVRVKTSVLNALMEMAGEMVLGRNRLLRILDKHVDEIEGLAPLLHHVSAITTDIQEHIMRTRLQPLGNLFGRFRRVVRDVSFKLGKEVVFETGGEDVELDRTIIEGLSDPLTHLVRNSLDHGIELPEKRDRMGKPRSGKLRITAYHEGGMVNIDIEDDGRGIDEEQVVLKALERGLVTDAQAESLTEREALNLIFLPGVSTATVVTDVSGRGVGMDVVRTNIEALGGTVDIASTKGHGTRVSLKLPLTLAIVSSLIVEVEKQRFALPQVGLEEVVRLRPGHSQERVERVRGADVLRHRGKLLPIVRLSAVLGLEQTFQVPGNDGHQPDRREAVGDRRSREPLPAVPADQRSGRERRTSLANVQRILVLRVGRSRFGLMVDRIVDNEEIVVKPLSKFVRSCPCFSGATILGDGTIAMILDTVGIAAKAGLRFDDLSEEATQESQAEQRRGLREPLSLLLFNNGTEEMFAMPLAQVARIEKIRVQDIRKVGSGEYLNYRDTSLPLIRLHQHLPIQAPSGDEKILYVIIPKTGIRPAGIVASSVQDSVECESEIDRRTITAKGLIGSTILRGQIVLLLDIYQVTTFGELSGHSPAVSLGETAQPLSVLLVEDTPTYQELEAHYLEQLGLHVTLARDGEEAWRILTRQNFDVVVSDLAMPLLDGPGLLARIRSEYRKHSIPVIALASCFGVTTGLEHRSVFNAVVPKLDQPALVQILAQLRSVTKEAAS